MKIRASVKKRSADDKIVKTQRTRLCHQQEESKTQTTTGLNYLSYGSYSRY